MATDLERLFGITDKHTRPLMQQADMSDLSPAEIDECFDTAYPLRNIDTIMARFGL